MVEAVVLKALCQQNQQMGLWMQTGDNVIFSLPLPEYKNISLSCADLQTEAKPGGAVVVAVMFSFGKGGVMSRAELCQSG